MEKSEWSFWPTQYLVGELLRSSKCKELEIVVCLASGQVPEVYCYFSATQLSLTLWDTMACNTPGLSVPHHLPEFAQVHVHRIIDAIQPSHPLSSLLFPPSIFPRIRVFSIESVLHIRWPKYWSFSFSISPSNEYSGLISFRIDWFDLLAVQGTLRSLLQHHSSKASVLQCSAFFMDQLSYPYMTTGKKHSFD